MVEGGCGVYHGLLAGVMQLSNIVRVKVRASRPVQDLWFKLLL